MGSTQADVRRIARSALLRLPPRQAEVLRSLGSRVLPGASARSRMLVPTPELVAITDPGSDRAMCPLCGTTAERFEPFGIKAQRPDCRCPTCGSLERHRLVWLFLALRTDLFAGIGTSDGSPDGAPPAAPKRRMLHIAPERTMSRRFRQIPGIDYLSADIEPGKAMVEMDITAIDLPDHQFDVIFASHVLEHIPDDVRAMSELRRVLRPDGWAVLEVPIHGPHTREDPSVTDPEERNRLFGQRDHVRMYGHDGQYERRLRSAGFDVTVTRLAQELGPSATRRFRLLAHEDVYLCRRASA